MKRSLLILVVILSVFTSLVIWINLPKTPDQIYDGYFEPYIIQTTPRGIIEETDAFMMGTIYYRDKEYELAIPQFESLLKDTPTDYRAKLMLGVSYLAIKDFAKAEVVFKELVNDPNHLFMDQARWYLGLVYLTDNKNENDSISRYHFSQIEEPNLKEKAELLY